MANKLDKNKKKRNIPLSIKVYCSSEEKEIIKTIANHTELSVSQYLCRLALNYEIPGMIVDHNEMEKILKVDDKNMRMGAYLNMLLKRDKRVKHLKKKHIYYIFSQIKKCQDEFISLIGNVLVNKRDKKKL